MSEKIINSILNKFAMPVVLRNVAGFNWGFFSNEDQRMHIQVFPQREHYKIWLENKGKRIFEPANKIPSKILSELKKKVNEKRDIIEDYWAELMIEKKWISFSIDQRNGIAKIIAYPKFHNSFARTIDLKKHTINPENYSFDNVNLDPKTIALALNAKSYTNEDDHRILIHLPEILFID